MTITLSLAEPLNLGKSILFSIVVLISSLTVKERKRLKSWPLVLFALFLISYTLSVLVNKQNFFSAFFGSESRNMGLLTHISILILLYFSILGNLNSKNLLRFGIWPLIYINLLYGFIQVTRNDPIIWGEPDRVVLLLGNSNYAGQLLASLLIIPLAHIILKKHKVSQLFALSVFFSLFYLGLMTQAFQFRVLAIINIVTFLILNYWNWIRSNLKRISMFSVLIAIATGAYTYLNWQKIDLIHRTNAIDRLDMSIVGLKILRDHFLFGIGIEQFNKFEPVYRGISQTQRNGNNVVPDKAHNVFIEHLANGGIFTGLFYILFIVSTIYLILKVFQTQVPKSQRIELSAISSIWITYIVSLFISTDVIFSMILGYSCLGLILKQAYTENSRILETKNKEFFIPSGILPRISITFFTIITLILSTLTIVNAYQWREVQVGKVRDGKEILSIMDSMPRPKEAEKFIVSAFQNLQNCPFILEASKKLIEMDARSGQGYYFKAICEDNLGLTYQSLESIRRAVALQPLNTSYLESLTKLLYTVGNKEEAFTTFSKLESINPTNANLDSVRNFIGLKGK